MTRLLSNILPIYTTVLTTVLAILKIITKGKGFETFQKFFLCQHF